METLNLEKASYSVVRAWLKVFFIKLEVCHHPVSGCSRATNFYTEAEIRRNFSGQTLSEKIRGKLERQVSSLRNSLKTWIKIRERQALL